MTMTNTVTDLPLLRMVAIPRLAQGGKWRVETMRSYNNPLLLWFTRGQGRITVAGLTRGYGTHNLIYLPSRTMHAFDMGAGVHGMALFLAPEDDLLLPGHHVHLRVREATAQNEMTGHLDNIQRELDAARPGRDRALRHHVGLLSVWLERQLVAVGTGETKRPTAAVRLAQAFCELVERDFRSGRTVADYALALGVTPTHLSRVCRETCGRAPSEIAHERQLFEARRMLTETRIPVQDIALSLGYGSAAYFSRTFQARTGKTPTAFRRVG